MKQLIMNGIRIELERKRIKNMYLRILPPEGSVHISAPMKMSEAEIQHFIISRLDWILTQQAKVRNRHTHEVLDYITGDILYIWGNKYQLMLREASGRSKVGVAGDEIILYCKAGSTREQREKLIHQMYAELLHQEIPFLLARWEQTIGVKANSYHLRNMKTRWGTCNIRTGDICLNLQLAKKAPICLEYVVVHELVHLLEQSHNQVFKAYMDRFLPQWRSIRKQLNGA